MKVEVLDLLHKSHHHHCCCFVIYNLQYLVWTCYLQLPPIFVKLLSCYVKVLHKIVMCKGWSNLQGLRIGVTGVRVRVKIL